MFNRKIDSIAFDCNNCASFPTKNCFKLHFKSIAIIKMIVVAQFITENQSKIHCRAHGQKHDLFVWMMSIQSLSNAQRLHQKNTCRHFNMFHNNKLFNRIFIYTSTCLAFNAFSFITWRWSLFYLQTQISPRKENMFPICTKRLSEITRIQLCPQEEWFFWFAQNVGNFS